MVSGRRRPGVFLFAIATMMFSLVLLSATSSGAQTDEGDGAGSARAAVGDDECLEFDNESSDTGSTGEDPEADTSEAGEEDPPSNTSDNATDGNDTDGNDTDGNITGDSADDTEENISTNNDADTNGDAGTDNTTGTNNEDPETEDAENGEVGTEDTENGSEDEGTDADEEDLTTSQDGADEEEECVVAETVPDESLLPTGAPENPRTGERTASEKQSDRDGEQESREGTTREKTTNGGAQKKTSSAGKQRETTGSNAPRKASSSDTRKKTSSGTQEKTSGGEARSKSGSNNTQSKSGSSGTRSKSSSSESRENPDRGETLKVRGEKLKVDDRSGKAPRQEGLKNRAESAAASDPAPRLAATEWTRPSREEIVSTKKPRRFAPDPGSEMTLSSRALGLYDMPVASGGQEVLADGLARVPETSRPWDEGDQKNVFVAGHYLGYPGTPSRMAFYNLHELKSGDDLVLEDGQGQTYKYRVSEKFAVGPGDSWAMGQVRDRDMLTLQTCIPPDFGKRLIVRADRVRD